MDTSSLKWEFSSTAPRRLLLLDIHHQAVTIKSRRLGIRDMHAPDLTVGMDALVTIYLARKDQTS